jgi:thiol:disulfide interchange protein DsbA
MKMKRLTGALLLAMALVAAGAEAGMPEAGRYRTLPAEVVQRVDVQPGQVEVLEFFWYGCPFCARFEPQLDAWQAKRLQQQKDALQRAGKPVPSNLTPDVVVRHVPVAWHKRLEPYAKMYYALDTLGRAKELSQIVYEKVQTDRGSLSTPAEQAAFLAQHGVDAQQYLRAYNSNDTDAALLRDRALAQAVKLKSVPSLLVQGRWETGPSLAEGPDGTLSALDQLVDHALANTDGAAGGLKAAR